MTSSGRHADNGLHLFPFRGLRYVPERVGSLAAVTSPPYDVVVRPDGLLHLESADPHNIVRLILPQADTPAARNEKAAATLAHWLADGILAPDAEPALYVYEQRHGDVLQRGLIGALALSTPEEGIVLPHEDVMADIVEDRAALMRTTAVNFEPLLLTYRSDGSATGATAVIDRTIARPPLLATTTEDGFSHRLWSLTDPAEITAARSDLAGRQALIADGHHRWATYLRLRDEHPGPGPWNYGLVLLIDTVRYPLRVRAIHRLLHRLPVAEALAAVADTFRVRTVGASRRRWTLSARRLPRATPFCWRGTAPSTSSTGLPRSCWPVRSPRTTRRPGARWTRPSCTTRCWTRSGGFLTRRSTSRTSTPRTRRSSRRNGAGGRLSSCIRYARRSSGIWPARV